MLTTSAISDFYGYLLIAARADSNRPYLGLIKNLIASYRLYLLSTVNPESTFSTTQAKKVIEQIKMLKNNNFFSTDIKITLDDIIHDIHGMGSDFLKLFPDRDDAERYCDHIDGLYKHSLDNELKIPTIKMSTGAKLNILTTHNPAPQENDSLEPLAEMTDKDPYPNANVELKTEKKNENPFLLTYQYLNLTNEEIPETQDDLLELLISALNNLEHKLNASEEELKIKNHFLQHIRDIYITKIQKYELENNYNESAVLLEKLLPYQDKLIEYAKSDADKNQEFEYKYILLDNMKLYTHHIILSNRLEEALHFNALLLNQLEFMRQTDINDRLSTHTKLADELARRADQARRAEDYLHAMKFARLAMTAYDEILKNPFRDLNNPTDYLAKRYQTQINFAVCKFSQSSIGQNPFAVYSGNIDLLAELHDVPVQYLPFTPEHLENNLCDTLPLLIKTDYTQAVLAFKSSLEKLEPLSRYHQSDNNFLDIIKIHLIKAYLDTADLACQLGMTEVCLQFLLQAHLETSEIFKSNKILSTHSEMFILNSKNLERISNNLVLLNLSLRNQDAKSVSNTSQSNTSQSRLFRKTSQKHAHDSKNESKDTSPSKRPKGER